MVAAVVVARELPLRVDRAAELARPEDERVVEHAAAAEVGDERGLRLVDRLRLRAELAGQVAVLVPAAHVELDEAHVPLGEPPREQAVRGERAGLVDIGAVHLEGRRVLVAEVGELGHRHLHAVGHLVLRDARLHLGVEASGELLLVQAADEVEHLAAVLARDAVRIAQVEHRVAARAQAAALVLARKESASPEARAERLHVADALRDHHHEARQVVVHASEAVAHPRAEARAAGLLGAGLEEGDARLVVDRRGVHRADEAHVLRDAAGVGQEFRQPEAVLVVLEAVEAELRRRDGEARLPARHRREALAVPDRVGQVLVEVLGEARLVVVEVELARRALHVHVDDALRLRGEVRRGRGGTARREPGVRGQAVGAEDRRRRVRARTHELGERRATEARAERAGDLPEEAAARQVEEVLLEAVGGRGGDPVVRHGGAPAWAAWPRQSLTMVASLERTAFATSVQAASSAGSSEGSAGDAPTAISWRASSGAPW